ncbi:metallophosphoesterase [Actinoplanes sp. NPDC051851]|uniref:metallophosphoesterase n=1 Tax=Actinoplanes sp. NPDC051851 TaxID=3154753 RepID=UPI0034295D30
MRIVVAVVAILIVPLFGGLHYWYLWRRLIAGTTVPGSPWRRAGTAVFVAGPLLSIAALVGDRALDLPIGVKRVLEWPGYLWLAIFLYLLLATLASESLRPVLSWWLARRTPVVPDAPSEPDPRLSRRMFVSRVAGGAAAAVALGTVGYGTRAVLKGPSVKRVTVPLAKLPRSAHGFRIAVVSDIHLSALLGRGFAQRVTDTINATQADLIAVVGDLVDGDVDELSNAVEPLRGLSSRHGTFYVTGNHEYYSGADQWVEKVQELGWRPLANARTALPGFDLAGVNDLQGEAYGEGPDFGAALGDRDTTRTAVLLAHQPVMIEDAVRYGVDLQLSGHTHGGQMWPATYIAAAANPTNAGLERYGDTQLYVSRGAGAWGPPVRVGAPSDITVIELAAKQA